MKKNGFTLIELLAVIAVMAVLAIIIIPNIDNMRQDVLERSFLSKVDDIETAAQDWAYDNINELKIESDTTTNVDGKPQYTKCYCIQVNELIVKSYIIGDSKDKTQMIDPRDKSSMNYKQVCVRYFIGNGFDKRIMEATLMDDCPSR